MVYYDGTYTGKNGTNCSLLLDGMLNNTEGLNQYDLFRPTHPYNTSNTTGKGLTYAKYFPWHHRLKND